MDFTALIHYKFDFDIRDENNLPYMISLALKEVRYSETFCFRSPNCMLHYTFAIIVKNMKFVRFYKMHAATTRGCQISGNIEDFIPFTQNIIS